MTWSSWLCKPFVEIEKTSGEFRGKAHGEHETQKVKNHKLTKIYNEVNVIGAANNSVPTTYNRAKQKTKIAQSEPNGATLQRM